MCSSKTASSCVRSNLFHNNSTRREAHLRGENEISAFFCKNATSFVTQLFKLVSFWRWNIWRVKYTLICFICQLSGNCEFNFLLFFAAIAGCLSFIAMHQLLILPITRKLENKRRAYYQLLDDRMQTYHFLDMNKIEIQGYFTSKFFSDRNQNDFTFGPFFQSLST